MNDFLFLFACCELCPVFPQWLAPGDDVNPTLKPAAGADSLCGGFHFVKWHRGSKTNICPHVARLCPVFVPIVSKFGQILSRFGLIRGGTIRTGLICSGEMLVKIVGNSGAASSLIRRVPVHAVLPRARATFGPPYDSEGADQVQSFQFLRQK
ncbi:hypothetical protein Enr10x_17430 [Gimesia panareensis]|uniref:Uncharacterized protein n=1 Tax=Gimesia panareensis TaxID=2527978 RepID=A0A517Q4B3_9PLAN|nr:hypothetical protein Enr10x_17430 [Gimesia panareensis]QDU50683.1 hypothetical protein Pan110_30360 [Gimesia panareensis]